MEVNEKPKTGLSGLSKSRLDRQRKIVDIKRVSNPVISNYQIGTGLRADRLIKKPTYELSRIKAARTVDALVNQGLNKYVELVIKEGWELRGAEECVKYLEKRLEYIGFMTGRPFSLLISDIVSDIVTYGNAFLYVVRSNTQEMPDLAATALMGKSPVGGYFLLPPASLIPEMSESGRITAWIQRAKNIEKKFPAKDIIHIYLHKENDEIWGLPDMVPVLEDVHALRQTEENILKLIFKHLNPIIQQILPDTTGTGEGRPEDMNDALRNWQNASTDGFIITPPGHLIKVIGAESQAIRAEGYLDRFQSRVFSGMAVSELVMGKNAGATAGTSDALVSQMVNRAKRIQKVIKEFIDMFVITELLMEGGFNPWRYDEDKVKFHWNEIELDRKVKEQTHILALWTMGTITLEETRAKLGLESNIDITQTYPMLYGKNQNNDGVMNIISPSNSTSGPKKNAPTAQNM